MPRRDASAKVRGSARFAGDIELAGVLHARLVTSPYAHALIKRFDLERARSVPGVKAVLTADDLPPIDPLHLISAGAVAVPPLASGEALYHGQPVAAVLAESPDAAARAAALVHVEYQELPAVSDPMESLEDGAPPVRAPREGEERPVSNVVRRALRTRGDAVEGLAAADVVVRGTWRTPAIHQGYLEAQTCIASFDPGAEELTIWTSTQAQFHVRDRVASMFGLPQARVRVIGVEVGGAFGGKVCVIEPLVAALSISVARPVRLALTWTEDRLATNPAPPCVVELETGMHRDGTLTALRARIVFDSGAAPGAPVSAAALLCCGCYRFPSFEVESVEVLTNRVPQGPYRAPGAMPIAFALEGHLDQMALELGLDPLDVRLRNAVREGDLLPAGDALPPIGLIECLRAIETTELWRSRGRSPPPGRAPQRRRGVGLAAGFWLCGAQPAAATVQLNGDGTFTVVTGSNDLTGARTVFAQVAAEVLGQRPESVAVETGDTSTAPFAGMTVASKATVTVGRAVQSAAEEVRRQLLDIASSLLEVPPAQLRCVPDRVEIRGRPGRSIPLRTIARASTAFGAPYPVVIGRGSVGDLEPHPAFAVHAVELEVDRETGEVRLLRWVVAQDVGRALNPQLVEGQIEGAVAQALGAALFEGIRYDPGGRQVDPTDQGRTLPTAVDVPPVETILVEVASRQGPYGARGVGEPPMVAGAAAVSNALRDAIGAVIREMPFTPERILQALAAR